MQMASQVLGTLTMGVAPHLAHFLQAICSIYFARHSISIYLDSAFGPKFTIYYLLDSNGSLSSNI